MHALEYTQAQYIRAAHNRHEFTLLVFRNMHFDMDDRKDSKETAQ